MSMPNGHVEIETLADLVEDLPTDGAAEARAHLTDCVECRSTYDQLAALPSLLASFAAAPVPPDVNARVMAALERESQARAAEAHSADQRVRPAARARGWAGVRAAFGPRLAAGLLSGAAVLGVGYIVVQGVGGGDAPVPGALEDSGGGTDAFGSGEGARAPAEGAPGFSYDQGSLASDVESLLTVELGAADPGAVPTKSGGISGQSSSTADGGPAPELAATNSCVLAAQERADSFASALAVDVGSYEGRPAVIVVLPLGADNGAERVDVWVLGTTCLDSYVAGTAGGSPDPIVLARETVRR